MNMLKSSVPAGGQHRGTGGYLAGPAVSDCQRGRAGFKCCRCCDKSTSRKVDKAKVFSEIPAGSMFLDAGAYWQGPDNNGDVGGSGHASCVVKTTQNFPRLTILTVSSRTAISLDFALFFK